MVGPRLKTKRGQQLLACRLLGVACTLTSLRATWRCPTAMRHPEAELPRGNRGRQRTDHLRSTRTPFSHQMNESQGLRPGNQTQPLFIFDENQTQGLRPENQSQPLLIFDENQIQARPPRPASISK